MFRAACETTSTLCSFKKELQSGEVQKKEYIRLQDICEAVMDNYNLHLSKLPPVS